MKAHKKQAFNIRPDINDKSVLISDGIYAYVRHPMYFSVLLIGLSMVLFYFTLLKVTLFMGLVFVLMLKAHKEEKLWGAKDAHYAEYMKTTKKIIPYIL